MSKPFEGFLKAVIGVLWGIFGIFVVVVFFSLGLVWRKVELGTNAIFSIFKDVFNVLGSVLGGIVWAMVGIIIAATFIWFFSSIFPEIIQRTKALTAPAKKDEAIEILKIRLAKGEITKEEYIEMRKLLEEETK